MRLMAWLGALAVLGVAGCGNDGGSGGEISKGELAVTLSPIEHLLAGGFLFGIVFMATDPVSSPETQLTAEISARSED